MMFSQRTGWPREANPFISRMEALQKTKRGIIDLTESNPTRCHFKYPQEKVLKALVQKKGLRYDPFPMGIKEAREAVSVNYKRKGFNVSAENIFLTTSTSESYSFLLRLLCNPQDRLLVPRPSYPLFEYLAQINDVALDYYNLSYNGRWEIDFASLEENISLQTRAVVLVNPNNPTGSFVKADELARINRLCKDRHLAIICDEVFWDYALDDRAPKVSLVGNQEVLTFTLSGASKSLGLPQMKLGWGTIGGPEDLIREAAGRLEIILDTYLSVNSSVQHALKPWFSLQPGIQREIKGHLKENYALLNEVILKEDSCESLCAEGGWYAVLRLPDDLTEDEWVNLFLEKEHVFVHPGYFFDFQSEPYIVLSLLCEPKVFREGVSRMLNRVKAVLAY